MCGRGIGGAGEREGTESEREPAERERERGRYLQLATLGYVEESKMNVEWGDQREWSDES